MLILSRKTNESIFIGDDVKMTVVEIRGDKVRIGIDAPLEMAVHRQEVYLAIERAKQRGEPVHEKRLKGSDAEIVCYAAKTVNVNELPAGVRYAASKLLRMWADEFGIDRPAAFDCAEATP